MALVRVIFSLRLFGRHRSLQYMPCHTSPAVHALPDSSREQVPHIIFQPNLQYIYRHHHQMGTIPREYIFYLPMTVRQRAVAIGPWQTTGPVTDVSWQLGGGGGEGWLGCCSSKSDQFIIVSVSCSFVCIYTSALFLCCSSSGFVRIQITWPKPNPTIGFSRKFSTKIRRKIIKKKSMS